jgi:hypothetical protein
MKDSTAKSFLRYRTASKVCNNWVPNNFFQSTSMIFSKNTNVKNSAKKNLPCGKFLVLGTFGEIILFKLAANFKTGFGAGVRWPILILMLGFNWRQYYFLF